MKSVKVFLPLLFFLVLFIYPVQATLSVDLNVSENLVLNCNDINCFNNTVDSLIYCAVACEGTGGNPHIYRFNSTFGAKADCNPAPNVTSVGAIAWININQIDLSWRSSANLWRFNMTDWSNCIEINESTNVLKTNNWGLDYYLSGATSWLYVAEENKILQESDGASIGFGSLGDRDDISLPNVSDNSTYWVTDVDTDLWEIIERVTNGAVDGTTVNIETTYGIDNLKAFDIVRVDASTEWLYLLDTGATSTNYLLYRINLTQAVASGNTVLTADSPGNTTIETGAFNFQSTLTSTLNGTLIYWVDGVNWRNESITSAPVTTLITTVSHGGLSTGGHYWSVQYLDTLSNTWNSDTIYFTVRDLGIFPYISEQIMNAFGLDDVDDGALVLAFVLSLMFSIGAMLKINSHSWQVFVAIFFVSMVIMWQIGLVPTGIIIIIFLGIAGLFIGILKGVIG